MNGNRTKNKDISISITSNFDRPIKFEKFLRKFDILAHDPSSKLEIIIMLPQITGPLTNN